jgi:hypothetical protein
MPALTVLLIRHGEKPSDPSVDGLTLKGKPDKHSLVIRGWQRAGAWAALLGAVPVTPDYPRPDIVYAANPDKQPMQEGSAGKRAYETIVPLCERLQITPRTTHGVDDETALVDEVQQLTGVVLICWEHKRITRDILPGLIKGQTLPQLPAKWGQDRFDVALRLDRAQSNAPWSFRQLFPRLLGGDLDVPIGSGPE